MSYSRFQKIVSYLLIVSILFLQTFEFPIVSQTKAASETNHQVISFLVDESAYSELSSKIKRYAEDVQGYLDNTRVAIFPLPHDINPHDVASINEKLYYQGDGDGLSQLVGTILIGAVPLPVVHKGEKSFLSLYPYTDFEDKAFVYDATKNGYYFTDKTLTTERPEVWHSIISPNTGDSDKDLQKLSDFLDKTHDFYVQKGVFSSSEQEPAIFYFDGFREQASTQYVSWKMYEEWVKNAEDLAYKRISQDMLVRVQKIFQSYSDSDATADIDTGSLDEKAQSLLSSIKSGDQDFTGIPDIMTSSILDKLLPMFHATMNTKYFGDLMKYVFNTGRYGNGQKVRVDTIPFLIDKKDKEMQQTLVTGNNLLEKTINTLVAGTLSKNISLHTYNIECTKHVKLSGVQTDKHWKTNFIEGRQATEISRPEECSVFRGSEAGSGVLTESDRAFSQNNIQGDATADVGKLYGDHSPMNVDFSKTPLTFKSGSPDVSRARAPLYDITGSMKVVSGATTPGKRTAKEPSYRDCFAPDNLVETARQDNTSCSDASYSKEIPSWMAHTSPTSDDYSAIAQAKTTPSIPADRDRYVDYQNKNGQYTKIMYPNLFRITATSADDLSYDVVLKKVKELLDAKSAEIHTLDASASIDLYATLSSDAKLLDSVVRHIIWLNLQSPTAKYKYVLEHYLDVTGKNPFPDVAHKSDYEIAYLGSSGNAQDMHIRIAPEEKGPTPKALAAIASQSAYTK